MNEYSSGPMIVMEVCGPDAVPRLRALAGPREPEVARRIRPACVRARFGVTGARPGVHVTDLQEDGPLESENVFYVMDAAPRA